MPEEVKKGPLDGIRVLEVAEWLAGPSLGAILGDWGAEVTKIERPDGGDSTRAMLKAKLLASDRINYILEVSNRNKKSVALDLSKEAGQKALYRLVERSDVFITSFLTPARKRLRIEFSDLRQLNHHLVYVRIHGYGTLGSESDKGGYDLSAYFSRGGISASLGEPGTPPPLQRPGMGDQTVAGFAAGGVAAALFAREKTGMGQEVDVSLLGSAAWVSAVDILTSAISGRDDVRLSRTETNNPLRNTYQTSDGKWLMLVLVAGERYWLDLCRIIEREDLVNDVRFRTPADRVQNNKALIAILDRVFATRTRDEWAKILDVNDMLWDRVQTAGEVLRDPQVVANGYIPVVRHPKHGPMPLVASPVRFGNAPSEIRTVCPEVGQHTEEVLAEIGYKPEDISALREMKVIG